MKILKSLLVSIGTVFMTLSFTACTDWGEEDPAAGNQIYPTRQVVTTYDFEYSKDKAEFSDIDTTNQLCEIVKDSYLGSNVLHLNQAGGARMVNPFKSVKLQNGAGIAFWVKTDSADLDRPLISFGYDSADSARFYFTANGQLSYSKPKQDASLNLDENDPATTKTGILKNGTWHFVALQVSNTGYQVYVDSVQRLSGTSTTFNYSTLVNFINHAPYLYIGTNTLGDSHYGASFDAISLIRNQMIASDWEKSPAGSSSSKVYIPVGASDCSAGWWTAFTDYFTIPSGSTFHTSFINHTSGKGNWNNWNLALTTNAARGASDYAEYFVLRSDAYGWGNSNYAAANISTEGYPTDDAGWTQFRKNMEGAVVDLTVNRSGSTIKVTAVATTTSGTTYKETYKQECGDGTQTVRAFLVVDGSYLQLDPEETYVGTKYNSGSYLVGNADFSSTWWTAFSDAYDFSGDVSEDSPFVFHFINNQSGKGSNWNNWILVCTTGGYSSSVPNKGGSATENFVLRSDAYGWGTSYTAANVVNSFSWDTYVSDMHGAECWIGLSRSGTQVNMNAKQKKASGEFMPAYTYYATGLSGKVGYFLTAELASLNILDVAYYPYFKYIGQTE